MNKGNPYSLKVSRKPSTTNTCATCWYLWHRVWANLVPAKMRKSKPYGHHWSRPHVGKRYFGGVTERHERKHGRYSKGKAQKAAGLDGGRCRDTNVPASPVTTQPGGLNIWKAKEKGVLEPPSSMPEESAVGASGFLLGRIPIIGGGKKTTRKSPYRDDSGSKAGQQSFAQLGQLK